MKTLVDNIYYYQDELGSTSHIANASGTLFEYYKYDLYGKPTYWSAANSQLPSSNYNVRDLFTGQRWIVEIGLYDDRNRFMSPTLGRFIQPDPIGFKGDASNLYRYCGNDWANRTDPMGLLYDLAGDPVFQDLQHNSEAGPLAAGQKQMASLQSQINLRLSLGYGATALAGLYHSMNQLQQSMGANQNLSMGFFGLAGRIDATRADASAREQRYAQEGTAIDRAKAIADMVGASDREGDKRQSGDVRMTNYGYKGDPARGDPNTPRGIGKGGRILTPNSVALTRDYAKNFHSGRGVYVNLGGQPYYIGNYHDTTSKASVRTIDVYDPHGQGQWRAFLPPGTRVTEGPALMDY